MSQSNLSQSSQQKLLNGGFPPSLVNALGRSTIASTKINDYFKNPSNYANYHEDKNGAYSKDFGIHVGVKDAYKMKTVL